MHTAQIYTYLIFPYESAAARNEQQNWQLRVTQYVSWSEYKLCVCVCVCVCSVCVCVWCVCGVCVVCVCVVYV